jgi:LysM repeat protein
METEPQTKQLNTPSPLVPQGALPDNRGKSHIRIAVFSILAVHAVLLGTLLIFGCKKAPDELADQNTILEPTNAFAAPPPQMTSFAPPPLPEPAVQQPPPTTAVTTAEPPIPQPQAAFANPQPSVPPSGLDSVREHAVARGESFYTIAKKYGTTMRAIAMANPGIDANRLKIGQKLVVPPPSAAPVPLMADTGGPASNGSDRLHTVKSGDNLTTIARRHSVTVKELQSVNNLRTTQIRVGQKLRIPERSGSPAADAAIPPLTPASSTAASPSPFPQ